ncbi:phosphoesterase family-domain-containing protein [Sporodiniella umbellata]|nr:phosphoesterase family-domain-containing protein [Sporodiniella umbellata]
MKFSLRSAFIIVAATTISITSPAEATEPKHGKVFDHILQIWFENQDFDVVARIPEFSNLAKQGILLKNFNAITHPSEPNYVAAAGGSNFGIINDDYYNIPASVKTIYDLLEEKGLTWKVYQENIPSVGYTGYRSGTYVRKHNPAVIFDSVGLNKTRLQNVVGDDQFQKDVESNNLPHWMFYTPDMKNDAHDTNAAFAGEWLSKFYEKTLSNPNLLEKTLILITFDENSSILTGRNQVWSLLLGNIPKDLKGTTDNTFYSHYSTLNTVELNWGLGSLGRGDADKTMSNVFSFAASTLGYKNKHVHKLLRPLGILPIPGMLTGKSWNSTHSSSEQPPQPN